MKKLLALVFSAVIVAVGLVSVAQAPANAVCPYTGCFPTTTKMSAPNSVKKGSKATVKVAVRASGQAEPVGKVTVTVTTKGFRFAKTVKYDGGKISVNTSKLKKAGKYKVVATFDGADGAGWRDSKDTDSIKVK